MHIKTTRKKVKIVGTEQYIKAETGELNDMQVISFEDRDFNFHKIWLQHVIQSLDAINNQKTKLAFWLIENMDSENKICYTQRQIAQKSGFSLDTVRLTVKALIDADFLVRQNQGVYRIHPDKVFKGYGSDRMNILFQYQQYKR
ncbi:replication/maintenance protein RepL [Anaerospora hongkongensis]|uniref:replication/maintenance protein RepL n=1 Tax=Anaerospora hongkongensis TaxID=244830 RepID=UPI00289F0B89|nr:replication/maintenance protein RepL [Anaerospora hongkongensis]